ncbi:hypothetical protein A9K66_14570 [Mesorhizobium sp. AA23]|nr:hypothetical protein A9K66_14570 [Mesorhizobium sp. AA23]
MRAHAAVGLGQLDALPLDLVDGTDMDAIGADYFHMLAYLTEIDGHAGPSGGWPRVPVGRPQ